MHWWPELRAAWEGGRNTGTRTPGAPSAPPRAALARLPRGPWLRALPCSAMQHARVLTCDARDAVVLQEVLHCLRAGHTPHSRASSRGRPAGRGVRGRSVGRSVHAGGAACRATTRTARLREPRESARAQGSAVVVERRVSRHDHQACLPGDPLPQAPPTRTRQRKRVPDDSLSARASCI